jgi:hypothetical protein
MDDSRKLHSTWANTQGTRMDANHSNKIINYKGIYYLAQCMSYRDEIRPKPAEFIYETVKQRIEQDHFGIQHMLQTLKPIMYGAQLSAIANQQENDTEPFWDNGFFSGADARAAYAIAVHFNPKRIVEIGCGNSTKWFRKAIRDSSLDTVLTSIDPNPRVEIAGIADTVIRASVIDVDLAVFDTLTSGDVLFCDGSHICFSGSDCCTIFLEVIPRLAHGVLVHIHDVSLPYAGFDRYRDVPEELRTHSQSEQFMFATFLLYGGSKILLPVYYLSRKGHIPDAGVSFWFLT